MRTCNGGKAYQNSCPSHEDEASLAWLVSTPVPFCNSWLVPLSLTVTAHRRESYNLLFRALPYGIVAL